MKTEFNVEVIDLKEVFDIPSGWVSDEYKKLLEACDFDDIDQIEELELKDYAILALQDFELDEAAEHVLNVKFGEKLNKGQRENLSHEMQEERVWEEYRDLSFHENLYYCSSLLFAAFPRNFPEANASFCTLKVTAKNNESLKSLESIDESLLVRLLADGMDDHSILKRFFKDKLAKAPFEEAMHIVWQYTSTKTAEQTYTIELYSSWYWVGPLEDISNFSSAAFLDKFAVQ